MLCCVWWALTLVLMQGFTGYLQDVGESIEAEERQFILENFGSLPSGMILFFQLGTGGTEWGELYWVLARTGPLYQLLLLAYIVFFTFGLFNILTGMVVEGVMKEREKDDEELAAGYRAQA